MEKGSRQKQGLKNGLIAMTVVGVCLGIFFLAISQIGQLELFANIQIFFISSIGEIAVWQFVLLVAFVVPMVGVVGLLFFFSFLFFSFFLIDSLGHTVCLSFYLDRPFFSLLLSRIYVLV